MADWGRATGTSSVLLIVNVSQLETGPEESRKKICMIVCYNPAFGPGA